MRSLEVNGYDVASFDLARDPNEDVTDLAAIREAMANCSGVVHLAGVSRVIWGEQDPLKCIQVNVQGTRNILNAASSAARRPWVIYGSSREVYGQAKHIPVAELTPLRPLNCYAKTKATAEALVSAAADSGLKAAVVRFSSVYGSPTDHADRVVPAFARLAVLGAVLRVDGAETVLDFTHVDDVVRGVSRMVDLMQSGQTLPTMHLVSGEATRLIDIARAAVAYTGRGQIAIAEPRAFDTARFVGDPSIAASVLGWTSEIGIYEGMQRLIEALLKAAHPVSRVRG